MFVAEINRLQDELQKKIEENSSLQHAANCFRGEESACFLIY